MSRLPPPLMTDHTDSVFVITEATEGPAGFRVVSVTSDLVTANQLAKPDQEVHGPVTFHRALKLNQPPFAPPPPEFPVPIAPHPGPGFPSAPKIPIPQLPDPLVPLKPEHDLMPPGLGGVPLDGLEGAPRESSRGDFPDL